MAKTMRMYFNPDTRTVKSIADWEDELEGTEYSHWLDMLVQVESDGLGDWKEV